MTVRISEYYDIFDVRTLKASPYTVNNITDKSLPNSIVPTQTTNPFSGFNNFPLTDPSSSIQVYQAPPNEPSQYRQITGQHKAPQAITNINIDEAGNILCYPPNISVPYWNKIIFRNYDYQITDHTQNKYDNYVALFLNEVGVVSPSYIPDGANGYKPDNANADVFNATILDYKEVPLFLKFDEYRSRSKVIFSSVDKTRNPDIEHRFGYQHGQMEPIKLNLSFSCNSPQRDDTYNYNSNLTRDEIEKLLVKCYWSIEWVYERESGN